MTVLCKCLNPLPEARNSNEPSAPKNLWLCRDCGGCDGRVRASAYEPIHPLALALADFCACSCGDAAADESSADAAARAAALRYIIANNLF